MKKISFSDRKMAERFDEIDEIFALKSLLIFVNQFGSIG
jgi:hypothetical protein